MRGPRSPQGGDGSLDRPENVNPPVARQPGSGRRSAGLPILTVCLALAACSRPQGGPIHIRYATWFGTNEMADFNRIVKEINARHHDWQLDPMVIPGDYQTKIDTMLAGRVAPDLFSLPSEQMPSYAAIGAIKDLDAEIRADKSLDLADYYPAALTPALYKGHYYGLPWIWMPTILYYNEDLFDAAHVPYPDASWDWQRFLSAAEKLTVKTPQGQQWGFLQHQWPPFQIWVWEAGGEEFSPDLDKSLLDTPEDVTGLSFEQDLINRYHVSPNYSTVLENGNSTEMFLAGKIAMYFGGASDRIEHLGVPRLGATVLPRGPAGRYTYAWSSYMVMASSTKHPKEAYEAWKELIEAFQRWKIEPPRKSLAASVLASHPEKAYAARAILDSMPFARTRRGPVDFGDVDDLTTYQLLLPIIEDERTASAAARITASKIDRILQAP